MCLIFVFNLSWMYAESKIDEKLVEIEITTIKDFSVQGLISKSAFNDSGCKDMNSFKQALMQAIRDTLHTKAGLSEAETQIFDINFTFWNKPMHKLLTRRARALRKVKFEKVKQIELEMDIIKEQKFE